MLGTLSQSRKAQGLVFTRWHLGQHKRLLHSITRL